MIERISGRLLCWVGMVVTGALLLPSVSLAMQKECTWLPDFRCGRHGRYEGFVPPVMNPYLFEDPFITTGAAFIGIWHEFPVDSITGGGDTWIGAIQARAAITDRIAFIATKDGYAYQRPNLDLLPAHSSGFTDVTFGFKGSAIDMPEVPFILTPSLRMQIPIGNRRLFEGNGSVVFIPDVSAAWGWNDLHLMGDFGFQFPVDTDAQSTSLFWHLHADYKVWKYLQPFVEFGGFSYLDGGDDGMPVHLDDGTRVTIGQARNLLGIGPFEGYDYGNFGVRGVAGKNLVAFATGISVPVNEHFIVSAGYEIPLTSHRDILKQRVTLNATIEF